MSYSHRRLAGFVSAGLLYSVIELAVAAPAAAAQGSVEVGSVAEAWYITQTTTACTAAIACPPEPVPSEASTYPEGTLHIGVIGGQPSAHAYVQVDLASLPAGATPVSGTHTLPISQDPQSGSSRVESAELVACLVTAQITDGVEGGTTDAPEYDCEEAQSQLELSDNGDSFAVDLTPFLTAWSSNAPDYGIALVPAEEQDSGASWQVTFTGKNAEAEPKISATIVYRTGGDNDELAAGSGGLGPITPPRDPEPVGPALEQAEPPALSAPGLGEVPAEPSAPDASRDEPPEIAASPQVEPARLTRMPWYAYPGVVYLPLALLAGIAVIGRTLIRTLKPALPSVPVSNP